LIERLSDEKSEFMAFASHEIRNPITAMRGYASLITDGTTGEANAETKKAAEQILLTGNEVLMLIRQFLDRSKLELGKVTYTIESFDISLALEQLADGFKSHITERGLVLKTVIPIAVMAKGDLGKCKEVLGNVIDNSLKYTREGGITLSVETKGDKVWAIVSDTGVGIPQETLPHLFQKFSRADAQKANLLGTGLGLYLGKVFVEGMGGKIWAESEGKGKGSRFIIELPRN
jgi:signal transduction histidine kinase